MLAEPATGCRPSSARRLCRRRNLLIRNVIGECIAFGVVAEPGEQVGGRDVVGHAVVDLHQDRPLVALQALDDPALPRRAVEVEGAFQGVGDGPEQFGLVAGLGEGHPVHVMGEVESGSSIHSAALRSTACTADAESVLPEDALMQLVVGSGAVDDGDGADRHACVPIRVRELEESRIQMSSVVPCTPPRAVFSTLVPVSVVQPARR